MLGAALSGVERLPRILRVMVIAVLCTLASVPAVQAAPQTLVQGASSWYGGPCDQQDNNIPALPGASNHEPGIAIYQRATLGKHWLLRGPNGRRVILRQTDFGPSPWTNKAIDLNYTAVSVLGYPLVGSCPRYPTGKHAHARLISPVRVGTCSPNATYAQRVLKSRGAAITPGRCWTSSKDRAYRAFTGASQPGLRTATDWARVTRATLHPRTPRTIKR